MGVPDTSSASAQCVHRQKCFKSTELWASSVFHLGLLLDIKIQNKKKPEKNISKVDCYRYLKKETHLDKNKKKKKKKRKIKPKKSNFEWSETACLDFTFHPPTCKSQDKKCLSLLHCPLCWPLWLCKQSMGAKHLEQTSMIIAGSLNTDMNLWKSIASARP